MLFGGQPPIHNQKSNKRGIARNPSFQFSMTLLFVR
jgi:hypothetical protein